MCQGELWLRVQDSQSSFGLFISRSNTRNCVTTATALCRPANGASRLGGPSPTNASIQNGGNSRDRVSRAPRCLGMRRSSDSDHAGFRVAWVAGIPVATADGLIVLDIHVAVCIIQLIQPRDEHFYGSFYLSPDCCLVKQIGEHDIRDIAVAGRAAAIGVANS